MPFFASARSNAVPLPGPCLSAERFQIIQTVRLRVLRHAKPGVVGDGVQNSRHNYLPKDQALLAATNSSSFFKGPYRCR